MFDWVLAAEILLALFAFLGIGAVGVWYCLGGNSLVEKLLERNTE